MTQFLDFFPPKVMFQSFWMSLPHTSWFRHLLPFTSSANLWSYPFCLPALEAKVNICASKEVLVFLCRTSWQLWAVVDLVWFCQIGESELKGKTGEIYYDEMQVCRCLLSELCLLGGFFFHQGVLSLDCQTLLLFFNPIDDQFQPSFVLVSSIVF